MVANYYTLRHIARQMDPRLQGWVINEAFSQNENELMLAFKDPQAKSESVSQQYLLICCEPSNNFLVPEETFARARRNSLDLFPQCIGRTLESISSHPSDRQIDILLGEGIRLVIQMFGPKANVFMVNSRGEILASFLRPHDVVGTTLTEQRRPALPRDENSFRSGLSGVGDITLSAGLKRLFPLFGNVLVKELLFRAGVDPSKSVGLLSDEEFQRLFAVGIGLKSELESSCMPRIYSEGSVAVEFSIIELKQFGHLQEKQFDSLGEAIKTYMRTVRRHDDLGRERVRLEHGLQKELDRIARTLDKIAAEMDSANRAARYEFTGELLKAHLHELHKGMSEAILESDSGGTSEIVSIPLDKNLTPAKNAERYFEKAKKSKAATVEKKEQKTRLERERVLLSSAVEKLKSVTSMIEMEAFVDEYRTTLVSRGLAKSIHMTKGVAEDVPFRVFRVSGNFVVWAGKSGENNDLLSTRYTKPKDLWFHARAVGGSHVVLKSGTGKGEISKRTIDEAAAIAAYYSKMKNSKLVPVSMCEGKYVRKPKGAPAGTVRIEREKVVFVEPRLPQG